MKRFAQGIFALCILHSCATGKLITMHRFFDLPLGSSKEEVVAVVREPDEIYTKEEGIEEYCYVERLENGFRILEERLYCLTFKEGSLIHKTVRQENEPPYRLNSYDLQTTYGDEGDPQES